MGRGARHCGVKNAAMRGVTSNYKGLECGDEVVAIVGSDFQNDGFCEVETENTENGFRVDNVSTAFERHIVTELGRDIDEFFTLSAISSLIVTDFISKLPIKNFIRLNYTTKCAYM